MGVIIGWAVLAYLALVQTASAHDRWLTGEAVPEWVKAACCGVADIHHMRPDQVHIVQGGYRFDGFGELIPEAKMQPSPDGEFYIFYRDLDGGRQSSAYCVFGPLRGA